MLPMSKYKNHMRVDWAVVENAMSTCNHVFTFVMPKSIIGKYAMISVRIVMVISD